MMCLGFIFLALLPTHAQNISTGNTMQDNFIYDPAGLRDPFKPFKDFVEKLESATKKNLSKTQLDLIDPLQRLDVETLNVVAAIWDVKQPRAIVKERQSIHNREGYKSGPQWRHRPIDS